MKKFLLSIVAILCAAFAANAEKWVKVTDASTLQDGDVVVLTYESTDKGNWIAFKTGSSLIERAAFTDNFSDGLQITLHQVAGSSPVTWTMSCLNNGATVYIEQASSGNKINFSKSSTQKITLTSDAKTGTVNIKSSKGYSLQYNSNSGTERFSFYNGSQKDCCMYKMEADANVSAPMFSVAGISIGEDVYETYVGKSVSVSCTTPNSTITWSVSKNKGADVEISGEIYTIPEDAVAGDVFEFIAEAEVGAVSSEPAIVTVKVVETKGIKENPYTVADIINGRVVDANDIWVKGFIIGEIIDAGKKLNAGDLAFDGTNIILADNKDGFVHGDELAGKAIPVALPDVKVVGTEDNLREVLGLFANPSNLGKEVLVYGNAESYFTLPGLKGTKNFELINAGPGTGVADVLDSANGPVRYYDVNGRAVSADAKGILIKVQGGKAVKVFNK